MKKRRSIAKVRKIICWYFNVPTKFNYDDLRDYPDTKRIFIAAKVNKTTNPIKFDAQDTLITGKAIALKAKDLQIPVVVLDLTPSEIEAIERIDLKKRKDSEIAIAAGILWQKGLTIESIAIALDLNKPRSEVHRYVLAGRKLDPSILIMFDSGRLRWSHSRFLTKIEKQHQKEWADKLALSNGSVREIQAAYRNSKHCQSDINIEDFAQKLTIATGADSIQIEVKANKPWLYINWSNIEILQSIMMKLGNAPPIESELPQQQRTLKIQLSSNDELALLTNHLNQESY